MSRQTTRSFHVAHRCRTHRVVRWHTKFALGNRWHPLQATPESRHIMLFFCHRLLNCLHLPVPSNHRGRCRQGRQTPCHDRRYSHAPLISQEGIARMNDDPTKPNFVISPWLTPRPASSKLTRVHVQSLIHDKKKEVTFMNTQCIPTPVCLSGTLPPSQKEKEIKKGNNAICYRTASR